MLFKELRKLRLSLALWCIVGAVGKIGLMKEVGLLRPGPCHPKVLWPQMVKNQNTLSVQILNNKLVEFEIKYLVINNRHTSTSLMSSMSSKSSSNLLDDPGRKPLSLFSFRNCFPVSGLISSFFFFSSFLFLSSPFLRSSFFFSPKILIQTLLSVPISFSLPVIIFTWYGITERTKYDSHRMKHCSENICKNQDQRETLFRLPGLSTRILILAILILCPIE